MRRISIFSTFLFLLGTPFLWAFPLDPAVSPDQPPEENIQTESEPMELKTVLTEVNRSPAIIGPPIYDDTTEAQLAESELPPADDILIIEDQR